MKYLAISVLVILSGCGTTSNRAAKKPTYRPAPVARTYAPKPKYKDSVTKCLEMQRDARDKSNTTTLVMAYHTYMKETSFRAMTARAHLNMSPAKAGPYAFERTDRSGFLKAMQGAGWTHADQTYFFTMLRETYCGENNVTYRFTKTQLANFKISTQEAWDEATAPKPLRKMSR